MNKYHEVHEIVEVMLPYTQNHMIKMKNEQTEKREVEDDAVNRTSSQKNFNILHVYSVD